MAAAARVIGIDPHADSLVWVMWADDGNDLGHYGDATTYDDRLAIGTIKRRDRKHNFVESYHSDLFYLTHWTLPCQPNTFVLLEDVFCRSKAGFKTLSKVQGEFLYELERPIPRGTPPFTWRAYNYTLDVVLATTWQSYIFKHFMSKEEQNGLNTKEKSKMCAAFILRRLLGQDVPAGVILMNDDICDALCLMYYGLGQTEE